MLSRFSRRLPQRALGICTRNLITQPTVLIPGEGTTPIFLNPPTPEDRAFGEALRARLEENGVEMDFIDNKQFQVKQENFEFDAPALPREMSRAWGFLWGNRLVKCEVLLKTLKPQDEYLRGYLEKHGDELKRKMKIHFPDLDWQSKVAKSLAGLQATPCGFNQLYNESKLEALAEFVKDEPETFVDFYRNNSYISSYDDNDSFGYNIPSTMEAKLEGLMQFDWDQSAAKPDVSRYVSIVGDLVECVDPLMKTLDPKLDATVCQCMKGCLCDDTDVLSSAVKMASTTSKSLVGTVPDKKADQLSAVLSFLKADGAVKPKDADVIVTALRGAANPGEAAAIKGKTDADLLAQFKDCDETRLELLVQMCTAIQGVNASNVSSVIVSGLFNNAPQLFTQFTTSAGNAKSFVSSNAAALNSVVANVQAQTPAATTFATQLDNVCKAVEGYLQSNLTMDKPSLTAAAAEVPTLLSNFKPSEPWYVAKAKAAAASSTGLDKVEALTMVKLLSSGAVESSPAFALYENLFNPSAGNFSGNTVRGVAEACVGATFNDDFSSALADYLQSTGKATPAQAELVVNRVSKLPEVVALNKLSNGTVDAFKATDDAFSSVTWCIEDGLAGLQMAYKPIPHPSFDYVNAY